MPARARRRGREARLIKQGAQGDQAAHRVPEQDHPLCQMVLGPGHHCGQIFGVLAKAVHEHPRAAAVAVATVVVGQHAPATVEQRLHYVKQDGQTVFKFAVRKTDEIARRLLERNGLTPDDLDLFVSHQANRRIIQAATEKLGVPPHKTIINIERFGNTTAATIPLALDDAVRAGRLKKGDLVLLASVGAGFTVGSVLIRWGI